MVNNTWFRIITPAVAVAALALTSGVVAGRAAPPPTPTGDQPGQVTILGVGDIMAHPPTLAQAQADATSAGYDFGPTLAGVAPVVGAADLAICHLENVLSDAPPQDFPRFNAPPEFAAGIAAAGFDTCSVASNHAMDQGEAGVYSTLDALDAAGLGHAGTYRTERDALTPTIYDVNGVQVGHLSYTKHTNGLNPPQCREWMVNRIDLAAISQAAARTRAAGAQIIVLSLHWGTEHSHQPDADQLEWAQAIRDPNIDLILGHHAHAVQPLVQVDGEWVAYGMGNLLARHDFPTPGNRSGAALAFTFEQVDGRWRVVQVAATPTWLSLRPDVRVVDLGAALAWLPTLDPRRGNYQRAYDDVAGWLGYPDAPVGEAGQLVVYP